MDSIQYDIIIIGAGAAGLMAMSELLSAGYKVCLLEAIEKAGGRMATVTSQNGDIFETGAEFIHGKAPLTKKLLRQASISFFPVEGKMATIRNGVWFPDNATDDSFEIFLEKLDEKEKSTSKKGAFLYVFDKEKYLKLESEGLKFI
ncbi:MAG: FAD-binding protein [Chitinophagaceae bacterium]|nr:MAG: FAD-binding protein [Chitinophagaceae bacterium]